MAGELAARFAMMRALYEGAPVTLEALSVISGKKIEILKEMIKKSKWKKKIIMNPSYFTFSESKKRGEDGHSQKKKKSSSPSYFASKEEKYDEPVDGRSLNKISLQEMKKKEENTQEDEDLACLLQKIDDRIVELAENYARYLVTEKCEQGSSL